MSILCKLGYHKFDESTVSGVDVPRRCVRCNRSYYIQ